jgi:transposase
MSRPIGSASELERRRRLAVSRVVDDGVSPADVANEQRVSRRSVDRWVKKYRVGSAKALSPKPHPGRPSKLSAAQERKVLGWIGQSPTKFGYPNELWTGARVAEQIRKQFKIEFNPRYVLEWLGNRGISSQKPRSVARERDDAEIDRWMREDWPRILKKRGTPAPESC